MKKPIDPKNKFRMTEGERISMSPWSLSKGNSCFGLESPFDRLQGDIELFCESKDNHLSKFNFYKSKTKRRGSSKSSLTLTKKVTASLPSIILWS